MKLFDTHCHLAMEELRSDIEGVVARAKLAGVGRMLTVGTSPDDWRDTAKIASDFGLFSAFALSPHDAKLRAEENMAFLEEMLKTPEAAAVGETGLDYHYFLSSREEQIASFGEHIKIAESMNLPLIIHSRDSFEETLSMLKNVSVPVIIHCFTYGTKEAEAFLKEGFYISFSGIATFPKAAEIAEAARMVPEDRILVETDAPYLAPVPYRGKRCEPSFAAETAGFLARIRGAGEEELSSSMSDNAEGIFGIKKQGGRNGGGVPPPFGGTRWY